MFVHQSQIQTYVFRFLAEGEYVEYQDDPRLLSVTDPDGASVQGSKRCGGAGGYVYGRGCYSGGGYDDGGRRCLKPLMKWWLGLLLR